MALSLESPVFCLQLLQVSRCLSVLKHPSKLGGSVTPTVNMLHASRRPKASLQTILEENPDFESQGSTETVAETTVVQPPFPPFRGGGIFNVSIDSPPWDGETDEDRAARVNRNTNRV